MSENVTLSVIPMRQRVAEEIRVLLARRRISGSELARRVGVTQSHMSRRLTGETAFDVDDLERIADALGVEVASLLPAPPGALPTRGSGSANRRRDRRDAHASSVIGVTIPAGRVRPQASRPPSYPRAARRPIVSSGFAA